MKKRILMTIAAIGMAMGLLAGCGDSSSSKEASSNSSTETSSTEKASSGSASSASDLKLVIVPMSLNDPYQVMMANAAKMHCDELGIEGVIQAPGSGNMGDVQGQVELVENLISNGTYNGIILAPVSADGANICIQNCQDAGIPVVLMDSQCNTEELDSAGYEVVPFVGTGNYDAAFKTGEWIREHYNEGVVMAKINGADGHTNGEARKSGMDDGLDGWANIVAEQSSTWAVDDAYTATQNMIAANPNLELIWCACDALGIGASRALEEAGLQDKIDVIAFDGTIDGLNQVLNGSEVANTAQFPDVIGQLSVDIMVDIINGEDVDLVTDSGSEIITADNAQEQIDRLSVYL